ncbi:YncE family protein, partial [Pseudescherichia sp.]|uniref:YncE family protein n=1 Tax=Pseudescherichia sp. TaxID=2055881 RepID=UPI003917B866
MKMKTSALALCLAMALSGCNTTPSANAKPAAEGQKPQAAAAQQSNVVKRDLAEGVYELALSPSGDALYVASAEGFKDVQGGVVYKLDPKTLKTIGSTHTDLKNFGMDIARDGKTLYVTNSLDAGISAISTADGKVLARAI